MKLINLFLFTTIVIDLNIFFQVSVKAQVCHFDSYAIINDNCVDLSNTNRSTQPQDNVIYFPANSRNIQKSTKAEELPSRILSDDLPSNTYGFLYNEDWNYLKEKYYKNNNPNSLKQDSPLSLYEVQSILGFPGLNTRKSGRTSSWIWIDSDNPRKRIEANFVDDLITNLRGSGFKQR